MTMSIPEGSADMIQSLIGCAWGRTISIPTDREPCMNDAVQIVVLHGEGDAEFTRKLCQHHFDIVREHTNPSVVQS